MPVEPVPGYEQDQAMFQAIGHFIYQFSQLELSIRARLGGELSLEGELLNIIVGPYDFTMLCNVTRETLSLKADEPQKKKLEKLFNACLSLNSDTASV